MVKAIVKVNKQLALQFDKHEYRKQNCNLEVQKNGVSLFTLGKIVK